MTSIKKLSCLMLKKMTKSNITKANSFNQKTKTHPKVMKRTSPLKSNWWMINIKRSIQSQALMRRKKLKKNLRKNSQIKIGIPMEDMNLEECWFTTHMLS